MWETDDNSLLGSDDNSGYSGTVDRPSVVPGKIYADRNLRHAGSPTYPGYFNINLFSEEPEGQIGNSSERFFYGPGIDDWDMALLKDVKLPKGTSLEIRAEFFDAFNHAQFYGSFSIDGNLADGLPSQGGTFGLPFGGANNQRIGQMALKLKF